MTTVIEIIEAHLRTIGADGLVFEGECGCELGDLAPCMSGPGQCSPGYRGAPGVDGGEWAMYTSRQDAGESLKGQA